MKSSICGMFVGVLLFAPSLGADDGATSIAAGGIVMKHEPRISMAKEVLRISPSKVIVDYDFRNDTAADVTTTVAFPVPLYELDWDQHFLSQVGFNDFQLAIDGKPVHFEVEARAYLKGRDVSTPLRRLQIDIASFGHFDEQSHVARDIRRLTKPQRASLVRAGLLAKETDEDEGLWKVKKNYFWQQTFPAHAVVHIWHQYTPVLGNTNSVSYGLDSIRKGLYKDDSAKELESLCVEPKLRESLGKLSDSITNRTHDNIGTPWPSYVDFILTTANTWKRPIEDFTLVVDRPHATRKQHTVVSFCWNGPITNSSPDEFLAHAANLVPTKELRVGFITIPETP